MQLSNERPLCSGFIISVIAIIVSVFLLMLEHFGCHTTGCPKKNTLLKFSALDTSRNRFGHFWTVWTVLDAFGQFGRFWTLLDAFGHFWTVWTLLDTFGRFWTVWTLLDAFGHFGHFWTLLDTFGEFGRFWTVWTLLRQKRPNCPKVSKSVQRCLKVVKASKRVQSGQKGPNLCNVSKIPKGVQN